MMNIKSREIHGHRHELLPVFLPTVHKTEHLLVDKEIHLNDLPLTLEHGNKFIRKMHLTIGSDPP